MRYHSCMASGEDGFLCPGGASPQTLSADIDCTQFFAGPPWKQPYARRIRNTNPTDTVVLCIVHLYDSKVTPPTVGGTVVSIPAGQTHDGLVTTILLAGSTSGATLSIES
jgi:hypothetical protein